MSPLDYWFRSIALAELKKVSHTNIDDLKQTVGQFESFAESLESEVVKKAVYPGTI